MTEIRRTSATFRTLASSFDANADNATDAYERDMWSDLSALMDRAAERADATALLREERDGLRLPVSKVVPREPARP